MHYVDHFTHCLSDTEGNIEMEDLVDEFLMFYVAGKHE